MDLKKVLRYVFYAMNLSATNGRFPILYKL